MGANPDRLHKAVLERIEDRKLEIARGGKERRWLEQAESWD